MPQVPKGCLTAVLGALALGSDVLFVGLLSDVNARGQHFICIAPGCRTSGFTLVMLGFLATVLTAAFLGSLLSRRI